MRGADVVDGFERVGFGFGVVVDTFVLFEDGAEGVCEHDTELGG